MSPAEIERLLSTNQVGQIAIDFHDDRFRVSMSIFTDDPNDRQWVANWNKSVDKAFAACLKDIGTQRNVQTKEWQEDPEVALDEELGDLFE